nr:hypothetical protein CFP56_78742 [Quercus suber]
MAPYDAEKPQTFLRIPLPSYTSSSAAGEITISHIPTKRDVAGLHNAIGITYRPPASILTSLEPDVPDRSDDFLSIRTPKVRKAKSFGRLRRKFSRGTLVGERPRTSQPDTPPPVPALISSDLSSLASSHQLPTPPLTPDDSNYDQVSLKSFSRPMTASSPWIGRKQERTLSVIYTPHGVSAAVLAPYIEHHLLPRRALPLTALFHGITQEQNPRLLGGIVANGAPGGVEIARMTKPRYWISAHDELKENKGLATVWIKSRIFEKEEVEALLTNAGVQETKVRFKRSALNGSAFIREAGRCSEPVSWLARHQLSRSLSCDTHFYVKEQRKTDDSWTQNQHAGSRYDRMRREVNPPIRTYVPRTSEHHRFYGNKA